MDANHVSAVSLLQRQGDLQHDSSVHRCLCMDDRIWTFLILLPRAQQPIRIRPDRQDAFSAQFPGCFHRHGDAK